MATTKPIITLTTDFGLAEEYVGVVKGVILSKTPEVTIVDLSHSIPPFNISKAAYLIASSYYYFPTGTIHLVVVDPGVGSERDIVLLEANGHLFLAPDNGVLSLVIRDNKGSQAFLVTNSTLFLKSRATTFHGRDIFAPAAAHLAGGAKPSSLGPATPVTDLKILPLPPPTIQKEKQQVSATIIDIDHYGNCLTNITMADLLMITSSIESEQFSLSVTGERLYRVQQSYHGAPLGSAVLLFNSRNYLEIAVNQGNAAQILNLSINDQILVRKN